MMFCDDCGSLGLLDAQDLQQQLVPFIVAAALAISVAASVALLHPQLDVAYSEPAPVNSLTCTWTRQTAVELCHEDVPMPLVLSLPDQ